MGHTRHFMAEEKTPVSWATIEKRALTITSQGSSIHSRISGHYHHRNRMSLFVCVKIPARSW
jgi:hypothetical protein